MRKFCLPAWVGTNDPNAKYHQFGTSRIPARPFLMGAVLHSEAEILKIWRKNIAKSVGMSLAALHQWLRAIETLKRTAHRAAKLFEEDKRRR
jgi:hypothetical protein